MPGILHGRLAIEKAGNECC
jgi:hypothetical protein